MALKRDPYTSRGYLVFGSQSLEGSLGTAHEGAHLVDKVKQALGNGDTKEGMHFGVNTYKGHKNYGRFAHGINRFPEEEKVPGLRKLVEE